MKSLQRVHDLGIHARLRLMIAIAVSGLVLFAVMAFLTISEVRAGSGLFSENRVAYEITRDFDAPTQSLLSAYPFFRQSELAHTQEDYDRLRSLLQQKHAELEDGHRHYLQVMPPGRLRDLITEDAYQSAEEWYNVAEQEYMPLVERGAMDKAANLREMKLEPLTRRNFQTNDEIRQLTEKWIAANQEYIDKTVFSRSLQLAVVCLLTMGVQLLLGFMIDRRVCTSTQRLQSTLDELRAKNSEVESFVYVVSHDLRAPLVNMQGFVRELQESFSRLKELAAPRDSNDKSCCSMCGNEMAAILDGEVADALKYILASSVKFERLINALLNLSRQGRQAYKWVLVNVEELFADTVASMRQMVDNCGAKICAGPLPAAFADESALSQVFSNLLGNAIKYRSPLRPLEIDVGGEIDDSVVRYWFRDNGLGVPEACKARLFQAFQRFHPQSAEGDGIGLALVRRIIERHGGRIWAESQENAGSTFYFTLPTTPVSVPEPPREGRTDENS